MRIKGNSLASLLHPSLDYHIGGIVWDLQAGLPCVCSIRTHLVMLRQVMENFAKQIQDPTLPVPAVVKSVVESAGEVELILRALQRLCLEIGQLEDSIDDQRKVNPSELRQRIGFCLAELDELIQLANDVEFSDSELRRTA